MVVLPTPPLLLTTLTTRSPRGPWRHRACSRRRAAWARRRASFARDKAPPPIQASAAGASRLRPRPRARSALSSGLRGWGAASIATNRAGAGPPSRRRRRSLACWRRRRWHRWVRELPRARPRRRPGAGGCRSPRPGGARCGSRAGCAPGGGDRCWGAMGLKIARLPRSPRTRAFQGQQSRREERAGDAARGALGEAQVRLHPAVDLGRSEARLGPDDLGLAAGEEADHAERVAAEVHGRATGEIEAVADVSRKREGNAEARFDVADLTELAGVDDLAHPGRSRVIAPVKGLDEHAARLLGGLRHASGLVGVGCQGLLAQDVLSGLQGAKRPLAVQGVRQRVVDRVDLAIVEQLVVAAVHPRDAVLAGEAAGSIEVARRDRDHPCSGDLLRRTHQGHRRDAGGPRGCRFGGGRRLHESGVVTPHPARLQAETPSR